MISFYLGGARSGKSALAETYVASRAGSARRGKSVHYVATASHHPSMAERIEQHRQRRPFRWQTHECPLELAGRLSLLNHKDNIILIDCLTLWLTNQMLAGGDCLELTSKLLATMDQNQAELVLVSTEVGQSLIPDNDLSRRFVIASGELHQAIGARADQVWLCQAGLALPLKSRNDYGVAA